MESVSFRAVFGKLFLFTVMGILGMFLIGPVIAVVATLLALVLTVLMLILPFAVVGYALWIPYQILTRDKQAAWNNIRDAGLAFYQGLVLAPASICAQACQGGARLGRFAWDKTQRLSVALAGIAIETVVGALIGGVLGTVGGAFHEEAWRVPMGLLLGGALGALVGVAWPKKAKKKLVVRAIG